MTVIFCHCAYSQVISESVKQQVLEGIRESDIAYSEVADLCEPAARRDSLFQQLGQIQNLKIIACYPRTIKWLFAASGSTMPTDTEIFNMKTDSPENILNKLNSTEARSNIDSDLVVEETLNQKGDWIPWFPVIDYDRCIGCKQCLNFCLFGVFAPSEQGKVIVANPQNCKTNCPACARVCPQVAIIFPKFPDAPINGAEVRDEDVDGQKSGVKITDVLKGDIYEKLRQRSKTPRERFAVVKNPDLAEQERCRCSRLARLQQDLNIPDEVIQSIREGNSSSGAPSEICDCDGSTDSDCDCDCDCSDPTDPQGEGCCCE
jgi:NAD-dependent dihydropyrimidine dehydrogenase PreA subunit